MWHWSDMHTSVCFKIVNKCKISKFARFKFKDFSRIFKYFQAPYLFSSTFKRLVSFYSKFKHFQGFLKYAMNPVYWLQSHRSIACRCCLQTFKNNWKNFFEWNLPSQVECLQYNNGLHITLCFINFRRHSIIVNRAHGTELIILTQNNSQQCDTNVNCEITTVFSINAIGHFRHLIKQSTLTLFLTWNITRCSTNVIGQFYHPLVN